MEKRIYECDSKDYGKLKTLLEKDPYEQVSFARQGYKLKDGKVLGAEAGKCYLYIKAEPEFFKFAEEKLKEIASAKRSEKANEEKLVAKIEEADSAAESGFGAIFG